MRSVKFYDKNFCLSQKTHGMPPCARSRRKIKGRRIFTIETIEMIIKIENS